MTLNLIDVCDKRGITWLDRSLFNLLPVNLWKVPSCLFFYSQPPTSKIKFNTDKEKKIYLQGQLGQK